MAAQNGVAQSAPVQGSVALNAVARNEANPENGAMAQFNDRDVMEAMADMNDQEARDLAYENRLVLDELMLRQDSIDAARTAEFDARLASLVDVLKDEIKRSMGAGQDANKGYDTAVAVVESKIKAFKNGEAITSEVAEDAVAGFDVASLDAANAEVIAENAVATNTIEADINENVMQDVVLEDAVATETTSDMIIEASNNQDVLSDTVSEDALAANEAAPTQKEEAYTRDFEFESMDKVLGEVIAKPAVTRNADTDSMKEDAKLPIKHMKSSALVGANSGYYVIANVYKSRKYLDAFMKDLKQKGLDAKYFYNKENGLHYVYLADYNYKEDAKLAYVSDLDGKYNAEKWIMQVDNASSIVENYYED